LHRYFIHQASGKSAYDYIVSAAKDLAKPTWWMLKISAYRTKLGGIQVAIDYYDGYVAVVGAPVAYTKLIGIRWEVNRQFQYEKTQSRIGHLWDKPELYIENSPLFHLPKVKTPLVITNDADGRVPWYQEWSVYCYATIGKKV
jgi:hypothetical protein